MIILRHGRFISGTRIFRSGEILPDTPAVQSLVAIHLAEAVAESKPPKPQKKREPDPAPKNDESDS